MDSSSFEDHSSDLISYGSRKETNLSRFIRRITPSLMNDMKRYLQRNMFLQDVKYFDPHKISLFEDIYAIVTLKEQQDIFFQKGRLKQVIRNIAEYTKRKKITIDERLKKKLCQLTPEIIKFYIDNNKQIVFRGNSKVINSDDWPLHLKASLKNQAHSNQSLDIVNLESESEQMASSQRSLQRNPSKFDPRKINFKKASVIQDVVRIMNEPQGPQQYSPKEQSQAYISQEPQIDITIDLNDPQQRVFFAEKMINPLWKSRNLNKFLQVSEREEKQSVLCYNFRKRTYIFINPSIAMKVFKDLKKAEKSHLEYIKNKQLEAKEEIERKEQLHQFTTNNKEQFQAQESAKLQDLIKTIDYIKSTQNFKSLSKDVKLLLKNGIALSEKAKDLLRAQQASKSIKQTKLKTQKRKPQILNLISEDEEEQIEKKQNETDPSSKGMVYWFNNDEQLYEQYQQDPYGKCYLMWSDDEDQIIRRANIDFDKNKNEFYKLVEAKSPSFVEDRMTFLEINPRSELQNYLRDLMFSE